MHELIFFAPDSVLEESAMANCFPIGPDVVFTCPY
jgi:hypothetical protein